MTISDLHSLLRDHARALGCARPFWRINIASMHYSPHLQLGVGERWEIIFFPEHAREEKVVSHGATADEAWSAFQAETEVLS